ncbi:MAG: hypothetical protein SH817_12030 [Leptospira sp.]|nr:hypothetical protein [Leptospira sp.]
MERNLVVILCFWFFQCTTVGFHEDQIREKMNFGTLATIKICTIYEPGISEKEIEVLFSYWNEELQLYKLQVSNVSQFNLERPGFYGSDILNYLYTLPLTKNCDRYLYLKGRTWGDMLYEFFTLGIFAGIGIKLEIQGAVETHTHTRGYIKAKYISTLQLIFTSPKSTLLHEGYHLLGCQHQLFMEACYQKIKQAKDLLHNTNREPDFFPTFDRNGDPLLERRQIDVILGVKE